jgi:predicted CXXCH cytochrome family protein
VGEGQCLTCHQPHQGTQEKLLRDKVPDLCFMCHDRAKFQRKNKHVPAASGLCFACHDAHASPNPAVSRLPINEVCLSCHPSIPEGGHAAGTFTSAGHPLTGKKDPKSKYGILTCASCHDPHSSAYIDLFKYKADKPFDICVHCHPNAFQGAAPR